VLGGCGGPSCHAPFASPTTILNLYTPAKVIAGKTYTLTLSVANANPVDVAAGFDVDIDTPASLALTPGSTTTFLTNIDTALSGLWSVSHSIPQWFNVNGPHSDSAVWTFLYTARPTPGIDTFYVAGNAVNGDSATNNDSDYWNDITVYVTVQANDGVTPAAAMNAVQVFPNPASNELFIGDGIPADEGSYTLADASGRIVKYGPQMVLDGKHSTDISSIAAGAYILNVQPHIGSAFSRRIVIKR
jgi:hypothetical protein